MPHRTVKSITAAEMHRLDRLALRRYHIPVLLLMDNAGRCVAESARAYLRRTRRRRVIILAGGGNNGGDGVAAARYLARWGYSVQVFWLRNPTEWEPDARRHYDMARRAGVRFRPFRRIPSRRRIAELRRADLIIDALLGTGFHGHVRLPVFDAIVCMNNSRKPILAVDIPSGLDADTGRPGDIAVKARWTVTLAAAKVGLSKARAFTGPVTIADIGLPVA